MKDFLKYIYENIEMSEVKVLIFMLW